MPTLGRRLMRAMTKRGMNQTQLARKAGITQPSIFAILNEGKTDRTAYIFDIADALEVNPRWLATGDGPMEPSDKALWSALQGVADGRDPTPVPAAPNPRRKRSGTG